MPPVAYRGNQVDGKAPSRCHDNGRFSIGRIASSRLMGVTIARLVPEINGRLLLGGSFAYGRILLVQPFFYFCGLVFEGLFDRLLGLVAPTFQIAPYLLA